MRCDVSLYVAADAIWKEMELGENKASLYS